MMHSDRSAAERAVEHLRADNKRRVEATKRQRKYKIHPCTFTVIEMTREAEAEIADRWRNANGIMK